MKPRPSRTSTGRIWPGTFGVNATPPVPPVDVNSVMNSPPPDTARVIAPHRPEDPAVAVVVFIWTFGVIHAISPGGPTTISPGWRPISRTGSTRPEINDSIGKLLLLAGFPGVVTGFVLGVGRIQAG